jgi:hypothetical protein
VANPAEQSSYVRTAIGASRFHELQWHRVGRRSDRRLISGEIGTGRLIEQDSLVEWAGGLVSIGPISETGNSGWRASIRGQISSSE